MAAWLQAHPNQQGETLSLAQLWRLAQLWYHDRLQLSFQGRTRSEIANIFAELGLTTPFWQVGPPGEPHKT